MPRHRELIGVLVSAQRQVSTSAQQLADASVALSDAVRAIQTYARPRGQRQARPERPDGLNPRLEAAWERAEAELKTHLAELESALTSVGDDSQLANVALQDALQKQQQALQMMSNVAKLLDDAAMAVIRKVGG